MEFWLIFLTFGLFGFSAFCDFQPFEFRPAEPSPIGKHTKFRNPPTDWNYLLHFQFLCVTKPVKNMFPNFNKYVQNEFLQKSLFYFVIKKPLIRKSIAHPTKEKSLKSCGMIQRIEVKRTEPN